MASLIANADGSISWKKVLAGVALAAALIVAAVLVGIYADGWAADQALVKVDKPTYISPTSTLPAISTGLMTLASAWSAALLTLLLTNPKQA